MDETYSIEAKNDDGDENTTSNLMANNQTKSKKKSCCTGCKPTFLITCSCLLTVLIVGGFVYLFGPLVYDDKNIQHFNAAQITVHHYRLRLEPNLTRNDFNGRASIVFNNARRTNALRLVAQHLMIGQVNITIRNHINVKTWSNFSTGGIFHIGKVTHIGIQSIFYEKIKSNDNSEKELVLILDKPLEVGDYMIDVHYSGWLNNSGLDRSTYVDEFDERAINKSLLVMEDASKVFPYFGNQQKVNFELSVARKTDVSCFSNVPIKETELMNKQNGYVWDHFKTTPAIPPASLALVIADYKSVNITNDVVSSTVVLKIYASKRHVKHLTYAATIFATIFDYFQKYFQTRFPLTKLDLILVDNKPLSSKLGLITVDSEHLLLNVVYDNVKYRRNIFAAISEAVALQWLRERKEISDDLAHGFGKFLAYNAEKILNEEDNELQHNGELWMSEEYFVTDVLQTSFNRNNKDNVNKIACILRMINCTLGERVFHLGFNKFLLNAQDEFWESAGNLRLLGNITGKQLLLSWLENPSYPVITVSRTTGWNVLIEQQSILANHEEDTFVVPLTYTSKKSTKVTMFTMSRRQIEKNLFVPQDEWILFNYNQIGYYRVNYQLANWQQLITQLHEQPAAIPVINRAQLISDAFALADVDLLPYEVPFQLIKYLIRSNETNYMPWKAAIEALNRHQAVFLDSSDYGIYRKFKSDLLSSLWNRRRDLDDNLCNLVEDELCRMQFKPCIETALELYDKYKHRKDVDTPEWVYCTALAHKQEEDFDFLLHKLEYSNSQREIRLLLQSLACTKVSWKITSYLEYSLLNINHAKYIWRSMAGNSLGRLSGLMFIETHWNNLTNVENKNQHNEGVIGVIIDEFLSTLSTSTDLDKIETLYFSSPIALHNNFGKAIASVFKRVEWTKRHCDTFITYLSHN